MSKKKRKEKVFFFNYLPKNHKKENKKGSYLFGEIKKSNICHGKVI